MPNYWPQKQLHDIASAAGKKLTRRALLRTARNGTLVLAGIAALEVGTLFALKEAGYTKKEIDQGLKKAQDELTKIAKVGAVPALLLEGMLFFGGAALVRKLYRSFMKNRTNQPPDVK